MAKTLATLQEQIKKLQGQADALRAKEAIGVIRRIKEAIAFYDLTPADLFDDPGQVQRPVSSTRPSKPQVKAAAKTSPRPAKYADAEGHSWVGHGKRPAWFVKALEAGKTAEDLLIAKPQA